MFEGKNGKKIEYLENERKKLWDRLVQLEKKVDIKPSDYEKEAKQASKKTAEYRNKAEERLHESNEILNSVKSIQTNISAQASEITKSKSELDNLLEKSNNSSSEILLKSKELVEKVGEIEEILEEYPDFDSDLEKLNNQVTEIEENSSKASSTYKGILSKKTEIDELHREIIGYTDEDEDGKIVEIDGLKAELENTYEGLAEKSKQLEEKIQNTETLNKNEIESFINENEEELSETIKKSESEYEAINKRIQSLLPTAMTAGLSSAFIKKKAEEEELYKEYKLKFNTGIRNLSLVSLLPIFISVYFLSTGVDLVEVIQRSPKIIFAFMPLYIPLIWTTISANKKVNLSKRLIEEYSHKQVLSMTIEGLSKQIDDLEDDEMSRELRAKLLNSFLIVSSENPGKLISNYQKSDNPLLNLIDRDTKPSQLSKKDKTIVNTAEEKAIEIVEKVIDNVGDTAIETIKNAP